jgi:hypothetical protein
MGRIDRKLVVLLGVLALAIAVIVPTMAFGGPPPCSKKKSCPTVLKGRMTGAGTVITQAYGRSHYTLRNSICNSNAFPDLKVQWDGGNRFDLTRYSSPLTCLDTPANEGHPKAGFDTIVGQGTGVLNGQSGASAVFSFTDAGEPGVNDTATITITDADGNVVFQIANAKISAGGNNQAHKSNK